MTQNRPLQKIMIIGLSCCFISLPAYLFLFGKKTQTSTRLTTLIQKTPTIQTLSPRFFSNYLGLNPCGKNIDIRKLDITKINKKLKQFPIFKNIHAEFTKDKELLLSYHLRNPCYLLKDYSNCAIDEEGYVIPLNPYYSPKKLPYLYIGIAELSWSQSYHIDLAHQVVDFFINHKIDQLSIAMIDLSRMRSNIKSHHEVIVTVEFLDKVHYLRLNPANIEKALTRYVSLFKETELRDKILGNAVFDARIQKFSTLKSVEKNVN